MIKEWQERVSGQGTCKEEATFLLGLIRFVQAKGGKWPFGMGIVWKAQGRQVGSLRS